MIRASISATGSYIPEVMVPNKAFLNAQFLDPGGAKIGENETVIDKFKAITGISERRYASDGQNASDLAFLSATAALESSSVDRETLDYIIVAHNFGDVANKSNRVDLVPSIASRVKALLGIRNPDCVAYDLPFGCPGWVQAVIQANYFILSGDANRCLVIGTETLSRVIDPHDRDSMIFSDGSGAVILERSADNSKGIISHKTQTYAADHVDLLKMDHSYAASSGDDLFIKMNGRKVYEFSLQYVPRVIKCALDKAGMTIDDVSKVLIHQANEKMDTAILDRVLSLYGRDKGASSQLMPMTVGWLGNSSVATVPTLLDLLLKGRLPGHDVKSRDVILLASVGAGMNINAVVYRL